MKPCIYLIAFSFLLVACEAGKTKVHGNGVVETTEYQVSDFNRVESSGQYDLVFYQDSINDISIEAESNILPLINVYVVNNKLVIENEDHYEFHLNEPIVVSIHHNGLNEIDYSGAGHINLGEMITTNDFNTSISGVGDIEGSIKANNIDYSISGEGTINTDVNCDEIEVSISGTGNITLGGEANDGVFSISGVGDVFAYDLPLENCYTKISGTGNNYFSVSSYLKVTVSGVGYIYYKGNPDIDRNISGIGSIQKTK